MISQAKKDLLLLRLFKIATIVHILGLIANLIMQPYLATHNIINTIISCNLCISIICISIIVAIKTMQFFTENHRYLIDHYKVAGFIIESCIAGIVATLLFFNQEITGKFVVFIADVSRDVHSNTIIAIIMLLMLFFCIELYHAHEINKKSMGDLAIKQTIRFNIVALLLKLSIIFGTAIGFIDPMAKLLEPLKIKQFDNLILHFTMTEFLLYLHTIIMILFGLWITIGIYYMYKFYHPTTLDIQATKDKIKRR